jgi:hypothetical protein
LGLFDWSDSYTSWTGFHLSRQLCQAVWQQRFPAAVATHTHFSHLIIRVKVISSSISRCSASLFGRTYSVGAFRSGTWIRRTSYQNGVWLSEDSPWRRSSIGCHWMLITTHAVARKDTPFFYKPLVGLKIKIVWDVMPCCSVEAHHFGNSMLLRNSHCHKNLEYSRMALLQMAALKKSEA